MNLVYPLQGKSYKSTSDFGKRWGRQHKGVDLQAESGTRVVSVLDGKVEKSGDFNDGFGGQLLIRHDTPEGIFYSRYAHLRKTYKRTGETVKAGERIGESGGGENDANKGRSTGPHLHFEFLGEGLKALDPEQFLKGGAVVGAGLAAGTKGSEDSKGDTDTSRSVDTPNVIDKIMKGVARVMTPIGAITSIKGASTPKNESITNKPLLEEIDRIKELLK
jgi:hypothetical protein